MTALNFDKHRKLNSCIPLITSLIIIFLTILLPDSFAQKTPSLQLDTISIRSGIKRDQQFPDIQIDSVIIELYLGGNRLAILPGEYRKFINAELIVDQDVSIETYHGNKVLMRIQMFVMPEQRKKK